MLRCLLMLFFACLTLKSFAQKEDVLKNKLSPLLQTRLQTIPATDSVQVSISLKKITPLLFCVYRLKEAHLASNSFKATLSKREVFLFGGEQDVLFINEQLTPKEELNTGAVDYTLNRVNKAQHFFPAIKGDSIFISIKERAFDAADIDLKGRIFSSGVQAPSQTVHASVMATIVAGAGNSSPYALGVAPASFVSSADFANLFPETDAFYQQKKISVQNHSYGTIVENFYGNEAVAYDVSAVNNPKVVQVFSAGNSGTFTPTSGIYNGVAGMANLTGNFKQSKNTISVTALDSSGAPMNAASKGPAFDGRVKPELAAYGEDGSSGAAALVSGTAALVQGAYKKMTGQLPPADIVKAILLNSADDIGTAGPDYLSGYGSLNAYKAVETVLQNRFFQSSVIQNATKSFLINVPANIAKLKVTVTWHDTAAQPNAAKALVNDIDVVLKETTNGQTWEPWVLNSKPVKDSLLQTAQRKRDTLNNVEQITIDAPSPGGYQMEIRGSRVVTAAQNFAVSFQFDTAAKFSWDYPTGSDALIAGTSQTLRWSSTFSGNGSLQYSYNGVNWLPVAAIPSLFVNQYKWTTPDTTATVFLRMDIGSLQARSDTFVISPQLPLRVGFDCPDSFLLYWDKLPAGQYQVYQLGGKYLQPFLTKTDTSVILGKIQNPSLYYSVAPIVNNKTGIRSNTVLYPATGVGCYFVSFYLQSQTSSDAFFTAELGTLFGVKEVSLQKLTTNGFTTIQTTTSFNNTLFNFSDSSLLKGENFYRLKLTLQNGTLLYSTTEKVYHFAESPVYIYPNPAMHNESIKIISAEAGRYTVRILNSIGAEIYRQFITNSFITLPSSRFAKGFYFVWVIDKQGQPFTQKFIIH